VEIIKIYGLYLNDNILAIAPKKEYFDVLISQRKGYCNKKGLSVKRLCKREMYGNEEFILHLDFISGYLFTNSELLELELFRQEAELEIKEILDKLFDLIDKSNDKNKIKKMKKISNKISSKREEYVIRNDIINDFLYRTPEDAINEEILYRDYKFHVENFD
jgi:hypothetical protein